MAETPDSFNETPVRGKGRFAPSSYFYFAVFFITQVVSDHLVRIKGNSYFQTFGIPLLNPVGADFRIVHQASSTILNGLQGYEKIVNNVYPPFVSLSYLPLTFFSEKTAYFLFTFLILAAVFWTTVKALQCAGSAAPFPVVSSLIVTGILYGTYPVQFALERGNFDALAAAALLLCLSALLSHRQVAGGIALGIGTSLKIYPVLILPALICRMRWFMPFVAAGVLLSGVFCLGETSVNHLVRSIKTVQGAPYLWPGNHSLANFFAGMGWPQQSATVMSCVIAGIYCLFAVLLYVQKLRRNVPPQNENFFSSPEIALIGLAFAVMSLATGTSHDYKILIQFFPFLMIIANSGFKTKEGFYQQILNVFLSISVGLLFGLSWQKPKTPLLLAMAFIYSALFVYSYYQLLKKRGTIASG